MLSIKYKCQQANDQPYRLEKLKFFLYLYANVKVKGSPFATQIPSLNKQGLSPFPLH